MSSSRQAYGLHCVQDMLLRMEEKKKRRYKGREKIFKHLGTVANSWQTVGKFC